MRRWEWFMEIRMGLGASGEVAVGGSYFTFFSFPILSLVDDPLLFSLPHLYYLHR